MNRTLGIIVTYNASNWLSSCIGSIVKSDFLVDLAVVDNASIDGTVDIIRNHYLESIKYFYPLTENLGFGKAHNLVFEDCDLSEYDFIFLLNQDAEISTTGISELLRVAQGNVKFGVLSPIHYYSEGVMDRSFARYYNRTPKKSEIISGHNVRTVEFINAAIWLIRSDLVTKIGGFNPLFQHYGEDANFVHRLHAAGYQIGVVEDAVSFHYRNQEITGLGRRSFADQFYLKYLIQLLNPTISFARQIVTLFIKASYLTFKNLICGKFEEAKDLYTLSIKLFRQLPEIYRYRQD